MHDLGVRKAFHDGATWKGERARDEGKQQKEHGISGNSAEGGIKKPL